MVWIVVGCRAIYILTLQARSILNRCYHVLYIIVKRFNSRHYERNVIIYLSYYVGNKIVELLLPNMN